MIRLRCNAGQVIKRTSSPARHIVKDVLASSGSELTRFNIVTALTAQESVRTSGVAEVRCDPDHDARYDWRVNARRQGMSRWLSTYRQRHGLPRGVAYGAVLVRSWLNE